LPAPILLHTPYCSLSHPSYCILPSWTFLIADLLYLVLLCIIFRNFNPDIIPEPIQTRGLTAGTVQWSILACTATQAHPRQFEVILLQTVAANNDPAESFPASCRPLKALTQYTASSKGATATRIPGTIFYTLPFEPEVVPYQAIPAERPSDMFSRPIRLMHRLCFYGSTLSSFAASDYVAAFCCIPAIWF
jgi:hypothetical protein